MENRARPAGPQDTGALRIDTCFGSGVGLQHLGLASGHQGSASSQGPGTEDRGCWRRARSGQAGQEVTVNRLLEMARRSFVCMTSMLVW